jgi:uncharacterized protein YecT (DUF1311 family)
MLAGYGAAPTRANDAEMIATCLQTERDAGRDAHSCIGRVSDPCLNEPSGQSTVGMVQCTDKETEVWDAMLNEEYARLLGILTGAAAESVRKAQRLWLETRDAECHVPYDIFAGGTIAQPIAARCMLDHTADRACRCGPARDMQPNGAGAAHH